MLGRADYASHKMPVMSDLRFVQQYMVADPGISDRRRLRNPFIVKALDWRLHQDVYAILGIQSAILGRHPNGYQ